MADKTASKRDPETGQFLPGNPGGGRPKGSVSLLAAIKRRLAEHPEDLVEISENLVEMAKKGHPQYMSAIRTLLERLDGPVPTKVIGPDDGPVIVKIVRTGQRAPTTEDDDG